MNMTKHRRGGINANKTQMGSRSLEVARLGFEPRSTGPKPVMMDPYTIGL